MSVFTLYTKTYRYCHTVIERSRLKDETEILSYEWIKLNDTKKPLFGHQMVIYVCLEAADSLIASLIYQAGIWVTVVMNYAVT